MNSSKKNTRSVGQTLISVPINKKFLSFIDSKLGKLGYSDRSSFIRDAMAEKLTHGGMNVKKEIVLSPSRAGKGGRPISSKKK